MATGGRLSAGRALGAAVVLISSFVATNLVFAAALTFCGELNSGWGCRWGDPYWPDIVPPLAIIGVVTIALLWLITRKPLPPTYRRR